MKSAFVFSFVLMFSILGFAESYSGVWQNKSYSFDLSDNWNQVTGKWGNDDFSLDVSANFRQISGSIMGKRIRVDISQNFKQITGQMHCGDIRLDYSFSFKQITGRICDQEVRVDLEKEEDVIPVYKDLFFDAFLEEFPSPVKRPVRKFISNRMEF